MRQRTTDIGAALNHALHAIEDANLRLRGVFQNADFNHIHVQNWIPGPRPGHAGFWVSPDGVVRVKVNPRDP